MIFRKDRVGTAEACQNHTLANAPDVNEVKLLVQRSVDKNKQLTLSGTLLCVLKLFVVFFATYVCDVKWNEDRI